MNRYWRPIIAVVILLVAWMYVRRPPIETLDPGPEIALLRRPECPHSWRQYFDSTRYDIHGPQLHPITNNQFSLPGAITDIPEFHDCQRLIENTEPTRYREFAAVFARNNLDSAYATRRTANNKPIGLIRDRGRRIRQEGGTSSAFRTDADIVRDGIAVGEVVSEMAYAPLGIGVGFNCLYIDGSGVNWTGAMVAVGRIEKECVGLVPTTGMSITPLWAKAGAVGTSPHDVPPVARWDFDTRHPEQLIGIKCDDRWCDVGGRVDFVPPLPANASSSYPRQQRIKGWYDEQRLAEYDPPPLGKVKGPGNAVGTVIPDPELGTYLTNDTFSDPQVSWLAVARVAMDRASPAYLAKYGFQTVLSSKRLSEMVYVYLCKGDANRCNIPQSEATLRSRCVNPQGVTRPLWFAKFEYASNSPRYYCVAYRGHPGFQIPPVVRWRWRADDETIWISCPAGCCEVDAYPE